MKRGPRPQVNYYPSRKGYYATINGKTYCLAAGPDDKPGGADWTPGIESTTFDAACREYGRLSCTEGLDSKGNNNTVLAILDAFLVYARAQKKPVTFTGYKATCQSFAELHGQLSVAALKPYHVNAWLNTKTTWNNNTKSIAVTVLVRGFNWAKRQGLISLNPIERMERPKVTPRGEEVVIESREHEAILAEAHPAFRQFVLALFDSGARPGEIANLEAKDWQEDLQVFVLGDWRKGGDGRKRVIYFTDPVLAGVIRPLMERYPTGKLFRNRRGKPWLPQVWGQNFQRIREKLGLRKNIFASGYRHRHCTELLKAKVPLAYVIEAMGHKGPKTIFSVYGHLVKENDSIRAELNRVAASSAATATPADLPGFLM